MKKSILHYDLDTFFISVERLKDSRLNNRPIMLGGSSNRGVVACCSYETRAFGVHAGMPMLLARRLCPQALVIKGDSDAYGKYSHMITEIIAEEAPMFEKSSIDEFYVDMTGMDKHFGCYQWSKELRNRIIKETGLPISFGLSTNKMMAKIATGEAKPNGHILVETGNERAFIAPMKVECIPMIGPKTASTLHQMKVRKVLTLRDIPAEYLAYLFGKNGKVLSQRANAIDPSKVIPYVKSKSIGKERTFDKDTINIKQLKSIISNMCEQLAYELRSSKKLTSCITIKIRYTDFDTHTLQKKIYYTACDHQLIDYALQLFDKLYKRRVLIRLVGVKLSGLVNGHYQMNLFEQSEKMANLYKAMDKMKDRFGGDCVTRLRSFESGLKSRKLSAFRG